MQRVCYLIFLLLPFCTHAQSPVISFSEPFPEYAGVKIQPILCDNGNTVLIRNTPNSSSIVDVFNPSGKKIATNSVNRPNGSPIQGNLIGFVHHGNEATMFFSWDHMRTPYLFRAVISADDGKVKRFDTLFILEPYERTAGYQMAFGSIDSKEFFIRADNQTGCYAVIAYDGFASETNMRIEYAHYNAQHVELGHGFLTQNDDHFKYLKYLDAEVDADKHMYILSYGYNTRSSGGKESSLMFSSFENGKLSTYEMNNDDDFSEAKAYLKLNKKHKSLDFLFLAKDKKHSRGSTKRYSAGMISIQPDNGQVLYATGIDLSCIETYRSANYPGSKDFVAMIDNIYINDDGSVSLLLEEQATTTQTVGTVSSSYATLGDIGIINLDAAGATTNCYSFRKSHDHVNAKNTVDESFFGYCYVPAQNGSYLLYNDNSENFEKDKDPVSLTRTTQSQTALHILKGSTPEKQYLFGAPEDKSNHKFAFVKRSDYNRSVNKYVVMMIKEKNGAKETQLAWITL